MNDIRRTILWVIFGFSLVLLWDQWQVFNGNKPTFLPSTKPAVHGAGRRHRPPTTACRPRLPRPVAPQVPCHAGAPRPRRASRSW